jgi:hypothetical protein
VQGPPATRGGVARHLQTKKMEWFLNIFAAKELNVLCNVTFFSLGKRGKEGIIPESPLPMLNCNLSSNHIMLPFFPLSIC